MKTEQLPSPCISICQIDPASGLCVGCYRSRAEIASWRSLTWDEQRDLIHTLHDRQSEATGRSRRSRRRSRA
ncbi:MAG: DUF1289 domain-containing protein [Candidatus Puniceispirillum sp. TMED52]|nr:DUF1289 domain-containing protein [SAR116 cluster bacterium]OUU48710.1 MAG: DUF1289 domain-containing protein [Candidatus Puniceispirillum sp. TMED52]HCP19528.1 DUF1289 domain-containing protein [Alphaproteobacteria bacterium]